MHAENSKVYQVLELCKLFGVSKQAYYKHDETTVMRLAAQDAFALEYIHSIRKKDRGIGGKKIWYMYKREFANNNPMGRDRFEDLIADNNLKVRRKTRKPRTTDSTHGLPIYPNLIKDIIPTGHDQIWVSDITYIPLWTDDFHYTFCFLSLILDAYTEEIVGYEVGPSLETTYPKKALQMALKRLDGLEEVNLIHHSDRGVQYASSEYVALLRQHNIKISMTESGDPKENSQAERINNTMKNELLKDLYFTSITEVQECVAQAVDFYNNERPHMSIDMMVPAEAYFCQGEIKKRWISYRENAIRKKSVPLEIPEISLPLTIPNENMTSVNLYQG